jgi:para-aminobenzoate synthetase component 1
MEGDLKNIQNSKLKIQNFISQNKIKIKHRISKINYSKKLTNILEHIHRGNIYEVNFCQEFYAENSKIDPLKVYQKLNKISTPPFATFLKIDDKFLLSASPERFVKKEGNKIISQPIKGTSRRLANKVEDQVLADQLFHDPKERAENIMIVDLVRNDLSKTAIKGSVKVEELCKVYSFKQVHQLISTVVSNVSEKENPVDIIKSLFPMGSMTGAPKISAMEIIEEQEETKRGVYSGAVGYFSPNHDFDFNVVIRSILYNKTNKYTSFIVGGAITSQSDIDKEYEECMIKAKAMKNALINKNI